LSVDCESRSVVYREPLSLASQPSLADSKPIKTSQSFYNFSTEKLQFTKLIDKPIDKLIVQSHPNSFTYLPKNLLHFSGQMFLMNKFFDGEFMTFGLDVIRHMEADQEDRMDPMIYIFPRMTKCTFYKYGVSGEVIKT
jgi:hypothetical protein